MSKFIHTVNTEAIKVLLYSCVRLKSGCNVSRLFFKVAKSELVFNVKLGFRLTGSHYTNDSNLIQSKM